MGKRKCKGKEKEKEKEKEEDGESGPEERDVENASDGIKEYIQDLEKMLKINTGKPKGKGRELSPVKEQAEPFTLSQDQIDLVHLLCGHGIQFDALEQMMGVPEGKVDPFELKQVYLETMAESPNRQEGAHIQSESEDENEEFEPYDAVQWETATEGCTLGESSRQGRAYAKKPSEYKEGWVSKSPEAPPGTPTSPRDLFSSPMGSEGRTHRTPTPEQDIDRATEDSQEDIQHTITPELDFVRALKDSRTRSKPYFRKGDILRVINKARRGNLDDRYFELLPFKPPGEAGEGLIRDFEPADQAAADAVAKEAKTPKEIDSFLYALNWKD